MESSQREDEEGKLVCARKEDVERYKSELEKYIAALNANVKVEIEDNLIGGFRYEGRDIVIDGSYRRQLLNLYREITI